MRRKLDEELKRERDVYRKSSSGEYKHSPQMSTCVPTPERPIAVSRSNSGVSGKRSTSRSKREAVDVHSDPFANFADFEQSALQSPQECGLGDNPFRLEEQTDVLVAQICELSRDEFSAVLKRVIKRKPSHREIIHQASTNPYL